MRYVLMTLCAVALLAGLAELFADYYVEPTTRAYGELIDATIWNQDVVANVKSIYATTLNATVTNGDSHDHVGGDGAAIVENALGLTDNVTANASTSAHGLCPKGTNTGTAFLRDDLTWAAAAAGGVYNWLINGGMQVWQRGTTFNNITTPANSDDECLMDRWRLLSDGNNIVTVTQETSVVPTGGLYACTMNVTTADKKFGLVQIIERKNILALIQNGACSLSFKARMKAGGNATVDTLRAAVLAWNSTADTVTSDVVSAWNAEGADPTWAANWTAENTPSGLTLTDAYQTFEIENITLDTASTTNLAVVIWVDNTDGTVGDLVYVTDVQLETGATANAFARRGIQEELGLCKRYCEWFGGDAAYERFGIGWCDGTTTASCCVFYGAKRSAPTVGFSAAADFMMYTTGGLKTLTGISGSIISRTATQIAMTGLSSLTAGQAAEFSANNTTAARIKIEAEM